MSTKNISNQLLTELRSNRDILQCLAFESLVNQVWGFDELKLAKDGFFQKDSMLVDELFDLMDEASPRLKNKIAWLLGVLVESGGNELMSDTQRKIKDKFSKYLSMIEDILKDDDLVGNEKEIDGFIFLLGHCPEEASLIGGGLSDYLGQDVYQNSNLDLIFSLLDQHPARGRFLLVHQGAKACDQVFDARTSIFKKVLACPECHGPLNFAENDINCNECKANYKWTSDIPSLVPKDCNDPEEYPESLVKIYETESRPRFVRVMGQDWSSLITREREREYLNQFLHPVDGPILDLGCGVGNSTKLLTERFGRPRVIAVDYSSAMLESCKKSIKGATVVRGSASALPISNSSLGAVNCSDALQALPDPQEAIMELARCMRPGASFTGFTFLEAAWPYSYFQHRLHYAKRLLFSIEGISEFLIRSNLEIVDLTVIERAVFFTARKPFAFG